MSQLIGLVHQLVLIRMEKGELNIESLEALKNVLKEYEIHTKIIEDQLEMCKKDHADLRSEMNRLMNENRDLYERLKTSSEGAFNNTRVRRAIEAPDMVDNLHQQLSLALEEKETLEALWKSSVEELEATKEKLQEYQSGKKLVLTQNKLSDAQKDYTEAIKILEDKQKSLKEENDQLHMKRQFLEDQLKELNARVSSVNEKNLTLSNSLKESVEQEQQWKSKYLSLEAKYIELDRAYQADKVKYGQIQEYEKVEANLKTKLEESLKTRDELQAALERCQDRMQDQLKIAATDRNKVQEAVALVEGACRDREEALARERAASEEAKRLTVELDKLVDEAGRRVVQEEDKLRKQYDKQLAALKDQLQVVEQERNRKRVEVEQLQKECERLQELASRAQLSAANDKQVDKLTRQLAALEASCSRLRSENEQLKGHLDMLEEKCRENSLRRQKLQKDIQKLVKDTQYYQEEFAISEQKANLLNTQLQVTNLNLAQLQSNTIVHRGSGVALEPQVSLEMYKRLNESYGQMNDKWKNEMSTLADKFESKLKKVKKQNKVSYNNGNPGPKK